MINPPIYRLTTAVSDIDQSNINRDIRDGNGLSNFKYQKKGPKDSLIETLANILKYSNSIFDNGFALRI